MFEATIRKWLTSSSSVAAFAKSRSDFSNALTLNILDNLALIETAEIPHNKNVISFTSNESYFKVHVKAIATPFEYPECNSLSNQEGKVCQETIIKTIEEILAIYNEGDKNTLDRNLIVVVVYPCSHNDKTWQQYFESINPFFKSISKLQDFRFINNIPGAVYIGEINKKTEEIDEGIHQINLKEILNYNSSSKLSNDSKSIYKYKINRQNILVALSQEMIKKNYTLSFDELQELFEERYMRELKTKYQEIDNEEMSRIINKFRSNGTGAKRAQLLLTIVNEKNRVHYRPNIRNNYQQYNLFYYVDENINSKLRKIKAFDLSDSTINDNIKIYFDKNKKEKNEISFETVGELRRELNIN
jgi:hypothetical protein